MGSHSSSTYMSTTIRNQNLHHTQTYDHIQHNNYNLTSHENNNVLGNMYTGGVDKLNDSINTGK